MNLPVHFVIYGHSSCFECSQNCTSHSKISLVLINKSRNAQASSYEFLYQFNAADVNARGKACGSKSQLVWGQFLIGKQNCAKRFGQ